MYLEPNISCEFCTIQSYFMRIYGLLLLFHITFSVNGNGQESMSIFEQLSTHTSIFITLSYPFDSLYKTQSEEIDAIISIRTENGMFLTDEAIKVNLRGKFRRMTCSMPPLLLDFRKSTLKDLGLNKHDEVKLVTHCLETAEGQENLLEERLCYQLYESLTPYAYRTLWLTVLYCDQLNPNNTLQSTGFMIEPDKDLEARLDVKEAKLFNPPEDSLDYETYSKAVAFNFLIGNLDWSVIMARNAKLFFDKKQAEYIVIPYDFDYCNIVGASYRRSLLSDGIEHPNDRVYKGEYFVHRSAEILDSFEATKTGVLHRILSMPGELSEKHRKKIWKYCETWYDFIRRKDREERVYGLVMPYKGGL